MALTTTQVNQAFLATLGRPAEGSAATWGSTSLSLDALLDSIFIAENTDGDFVEYLYQNILGRASDAEGKAFWNSLLATTSKEAVLAQFKAAVIAAGQADPANADYQSFIAQNKAFVTELYTNLLGRTDAASADAEGVEFWANALASGTSKGALLAQFTAAALSDPNSDDAQTLNAKVNVANAITAKFNNFNADVTADEKKAALEALKTTMTEVVAGSTAEDFQERIDTFAGNYQNKVAQVFTTKDNDQLDASEATASTVFSGNVNLIDPAKGTIQSGDSVTGNSNYTDTLRVSVTSDSANKDFNLTSNLPTSVSSIEKLIITAGAANVSGTLNGTNYAESTTITSTGDVDLKISGDQTELKVTAGDKKDATITVESGLLNNYTGSAAKDDINVQTGASVKTIDTGAGKDVVTIASDAKIENEGSIKLGAGDDELTIGAILKLDKDTLNKISLDGGEGSKDKLTISTDITAVNSITGFETIDAKTDAKISADAANSLTSSTKLSDKSVLAIDMNGKNSLNLKNLKVGNTTDNKLGTASVAIDGVAKGEITLTSTTNNAIVETITLAQTEDGKTGTVTINGIGAAKLTNNAKDGNGDKLAITGITLTGIEQIKNYNKLPALDANKVYYINTAISSADDLASKSTVYSFVGDYTTLSGKTLVALNNSAQNKSYIFEINSTGKVNKNDITLKAIVDNAINSKDKITGGAIEFVADTEKKDVKPSGVLAYSGTSIDLSTGTYTVSGGSQETFVSNTQKLIITDISGALAVSNGSNTIDAFVTDASGKVTKGTGADNATINLFLGGSENASGAITAGNETFTADLTGTGATNVYINTSNASGIIFGDVSKFGGKKVDLKGKAAADVAATVKITTVIEKTGTDNNVIKVSDLFSNVTSNDSITFSTASGATTIEGSAGKDNITIASDAANKATINLGAADGAADIVKYAATAVTAFKGDTISNFGSEDKINLADSTIGAVTDTTATATGNITFETGKAYTVDFSATDKAANQIKFGDLFDASGKAFKTTITADAKGIIIAKGNDGNSAIYAVKDGNSDTTIASTEVALVAIVDNTTLTAANNLVMA